MSLRPDDLSSHTLSARQVRELVGTLNAFPAGARERGRPYASGGRVGPLRFETGAVGARVRGTRLYTVWWVWEHDQWSGSCSCPLGIECKHQYAVACAILEPLRNQSGRIDPRLLRLLPAEPALEAPLGMPDPATRPAGGDADLDDLDDDEEPAEEDAPHDSGAAARARLAHREPWWPTAQSSGAPLPPATLAALRRARDPWGRSNALRDLLAERPGTMVPLFEPQFATLFAEPDFDLMCWRLAQALPRWTSGWLPPALEPYRNRPDLHEREIETTRLALEGRLEEWSAERVEPDRHLRFVAGFEREHGGPPRLLVEARLTSKRLRDEPRTFDQLSQLQRAVERRTSTLHPLESDLLDTILVISETWGMGSVDGIAGFAARLLRGLLEVGAGTDAVVWDESLDPELAARGGITPGTTIRLAASGATIEPVCVEHDGAPVIALQLRRADGTQRPLDQVLVLRPGRDRGRPPVLAICDGEVHVVKREPPHEIREMMESVGGMRLDPRRHGPLVDRLARRFPSMRDSLRPFTRVMPVEPVVALDLRENDWIQIRLFGATPGAHWKPLLPAAGPERVHEFAPPGDWREWRPARERPSESSYFPMLSSGDAVASHAPETPGAAAGDPAARTADSIDRAWIERLDPEAVAPAIEWLERAGATRGDAAGAGGPRTVDASIGWWLPLDARHAAAFFEAWESRPPGVQWYCSTDTQRMLGEIRPVRGSLRVESSGVDWFTVSAEWEAEGLSLGEEELAALRRSSGPYVKIGSRWLRREDADRIERANEAFADLGLEPGTGPRRMSVWQLAQVQPETLRLFESLAEGPEAVESVRRLRQAIADFRGLPEVEVSPGFRGELRPYQRQGVDFLAFVTGLGMGAILADDMGLGKTVQTLAWLLWLRDRTPDLGPALVVCPASVVHNWARETERFAPGLRVALLTSGGHRHELLREAGNHDLLVTNYALLRRDLEVWKSVPLGVAILDEAQNIKNPNAAVSRAALELQARHRLILTGTPLENRALDLWSLMAFANPGMLGSRSRFVATYDGAAATPWARKLLAARLRPVLLRRMKSEVARDLPERIEERFDCDLHPGQRRLYLGELARSRALVQSLSGTPDGLERNRIEVLAALTRLRQICCHPALAGGADTLGSGKFDALWEILEPLLAENQKVLVFSQFVRCLDLIETELKTRGIRYYVLTGKTIRREEVVNAFQTDERPCVFLVSLKAGGTGLNLTAAAHVVLFDPWWNPAVEAQAIDRSHRIGQTQTVIAYRLLTRGTLEEKIFELQQRKAALAQDILGEDGFARSLSRGDLEYLLAPE